MNELRKDPITTHKQSTKGGINLKMLGGLFVVSLVMYSLGYLTSENSWLTLPKQNNNSANSELPADLSYESVEEVYDTLRVNFEGELNEADLIDGLKKGLADASGDPYTDYFNAEETESFYGDLNGSFEGIGAELGTEDNLLKIVSPLSGFPAEKAGLRAGDIISKIDGEDSLNITVEEAVSKIRGEKGSKVTLTVIRNNEELEFTITRDTIVVPSVEYEVKEGDIGYIQVTRFAEDTSELVLEAAQELKNKNIKSVVLDLRNNSGGYVDAGVSVASLWLKDNEVVFEQRTGDKTIGKELADGTPLLSGLPTVVLINEGSASASEIVAGALKDNGVAKLVGETSFGKGSVQRLEELSDGSTLKVTIAKWFTPSGVNIDESGIEPDIKVEYTEEDIEKERDPRLEKAVEILKQQN